MADPAVINDGEQYRRITKSQSELSEVVAKYREWKKVHSDLGEARGMLGESDPDLRQMAMDEVARQERDVHVPAGNHHCHFLPRA